MRVMSVSLGGVVGECVASRAAQVARDTGPSAAFSGIAAYGSIAATPDALRPAQSDVFLRGGCALPDPRHAAPIAKRDGSEGSTSTKPVRVALNSELNQGV